jgi:hypothetical protein
MARTQDFCSDESQSGEYVRIGKGVDDDNDNDVTNNEYNFSKTTGQDENETI